MEKTTFDKIKEEMQNLNLSGEQQLIFTLGWAYMKQPYEEHYNVMLVEIEQLKEIIKKKDDIIKDFMEKSENSYLHNTTDYDKCIKLINDLVVENQGLKLYKDNEPERMIAFGEYLQNREDAIYTVAGVYNAFLKEKL